MNCRNGHPNRVAPRKLMVSNNSIPDLTLNMPKSNFMKNPPHGALVWFRRDLRAFDHAALHHALLAGGPVYCVFVFDTAILAGLPRDDRRVAFIHASLADLAGELEALGGHLLVRHGDALTEIPALAASALATAVSRAMAAGS